MQKNRNTIANYKNNSAFVCYPFGMLMPGRQNANAAFADEYRYGFNTQEKDNEIYGEGNSTTAEYWQYDARLGRRWNMEPKPNPSISYYSCYANNPIIFIDVLGDTTDYYAM